MPFLPVIVVHIVFALSVVLSYVSVLVSKRLFKLQDWEFYQHNYYLTILFIAFEYILLHCLFHIAGNVIVFAFHGDPIDLGQKSKLFKGRGHKCWNHAVCKESLQGKVSRNKVIVGYEYDEKFHYHGPVDKDIIKDTTTIVFFHGNGSAACEFHWFARFVQEKYPNINVCLFEYPGWGRRGAENTSIYSLESVRNEISETWTAISTKFKCKSMIAAGLSLGGSFSWSSVDRLDPAPTQLVLMNTFADMPVIFRRELGVIYYHMFKFLIPRPLSGYRIFDLQSKWRGEVVVIYTEDDQLFPPEQANIFKKHFDENLQCKYRGIALPDGGHRDAVVRHKKEWIDCFNIL